MTNISKLCFLLITLFLYSCGQQGIGTDENGNEKFEDFYAYFYQDSSFQMSRIDFPLLSKDPERMKAYYSIEEEKWILLHLITEENSLELVRKINRNADVVKEEIFVHGAAKIDIEYNLVNKKWMMTYYSGLQSLHQKPPASSSPTAPSQTINIPE